MKTFKQSLAVIFMGLSLLSLASISACAQTSTRESSGQYVDSSAVTAKVKAALLSIQGLNSTQISVKTYKGVVQLSGFVNSKADSTLAARTAKSVNGVVKVENDLKIKSSIG